MRLIHIHIPRTGGTTFKRVLDQVYGKENICSLASPDSLRLQSPMGLFIRDGSCDYYKNSLRFSEEWWAFRQEVSEIESKMTVFHGHIPLHLYPEYIQEESIVIAWLRHPVFLQISWWLWENAFPSLGLDCPNIYEFVELPERRNIMSRMTAQDADYYGIYEFMHPCLAHITEMLDWPLNITVPHTNKIPRIDYWAKYSVLASDQKLAAHIKQTNKEDMRFYVKEMKRSVLWNI